MSWRGVARSIWPYVVPLGVIALEWQLLSPAPALADHFQFWAAGHLAATGRSPYDRDAWVAMAALGAVPEGVAVSTVSQNLALTRYMWLYPPQTAFALVPFGALPVALGVPLLHLAVLAATVLGVVLAARTIGLTGTRLAFALTLTAVSQPFVIGVRDGHPIGLVLAGLTLVFAGLRDRRAWPLALGVVLVSLKPHIAIAFGLAALLYVVVRRDRRTFAVAGLALAAVTIPPALLFPFAALGGAAEERLALDLSTIGALARDLGDGPALVAAIVLVALGATVAALRASSADRRDAVLFGAGMALSLALSPYVHDYDQLLVLPAAYAALRLAQGSRAELAVMALVALLVAVLPWVLFFWWPLLDQGDRRFQAGALGALPILVLAGLAAAAWMAQRTRNISTASA